MITTMLFNILISSASGKQRPIARNSTTVSKCIFNIIFNYRRIVYVFRRERRCTNHSSVYGRVNLPIHVSDYFSPQFNSLKYCETDKADCRYTSSRPVRHASNSRGLWRLEKGEFKTSASSLFPRFSSRGTTLGSTTICLISIPVPEDLLTIRGSG